MAKTKPLSERAAKALKLFEETTNYHQTFVDKARKRYRSYLGILEPRSDAASWQSQLAPPYVRNIVETTLAAQIAEKLQFQVKPRPKFYTPEEMESARKGAKAHEILHHAQFKADHIDEKQRDFALQNAIVGFTVAKTSWRSDYRTRPCLKAVDVGLETVGYPVGVYDLREYVETKRDYHGPCTEVVNIEDFFWHEAAVDIQRSPIVAHRIWMHFTELKEAEKAGTYQNVDELKDAAEQSSDYRVYDADDRRRTKDMIEVLEIYFREPDGIQVCTLGNRRVELKPCRKLPFWHGEYPFVTAATEPDLFQIPGLSQVGKIAHLQEAVWDFLNQTADNTHLINNFILGVNESMVEDLDAQEMAPGERWLVNGDVNEAFQVFKPDAITAQVALPYIGMLQRDIQTLAGTQPFTTTSEAGTIGAGTATEAALLTNIAQQSTKMQQRQLMLAYGRIGQQRTQLNQQFIRKPIYVETLGLDSEEEFAEIAPHLLQGDYDFDITPMAESLMRSERRAEANAMVQTFAQLAPVWLALAQAGASPPPNGEAFFKRWIEGYDEDPQGYFSAKPPPPAQIPGGPPPPQGAPPNGNGAGITSPLASAPTSPSHQSSVSPEAMLQRLGAMSGGVANT